MQRMVKSQLDDQAVTFPAQSSHMLGGRCLALGGTTLNVIFEVSWNHLAKTVSSNDTSIKALVRSTLK